MAQCESDEMFGARPGMQGTRSHGTGLAYTLHPRSQACTCSSTFPFHFMPYTCSREELDFIPDHPIYHANSAPPLLLYHPKRKKHSQSPSFSQSTPFMHPKTNETRYNRSHRRRPIHPSSQHRVQPNPIQSMHPIPSSCQKK
jgi:hypothetical protein